MKHWKVSYIVEYIDRKKEEMTAVVKARNIVKALETAIETVTDPLRKQLKVSRVIIWDICIIEDDVFPEEGEDYDQ